MPPDSLYLQVEPLTPLEFHVLLALSWRHDHAYALAHRITKDTQDDWRVSTNGIRRTLTRFTEFGWVEPLNYKPPGHKQAQPYRLTSAGEHQLNYEFNRLEWLISVGRRRLSGEEEHKWYDV